MHQLLLRFVVVCWLFSAAEAVVGGLRIGGSSKLQDATKDRGKFVRSLTNNRISSSAAYE